LRGPGGSVNGRSGHQNLEIPKQGENLMSLKIYWCRFALPVGVGLALFVTAGRNAQPLPQQPSTAPAEVKIDNFTYSPVTVTVATGTAVKWTNRDDIPHTVVSEDKTTFKSKALDTDDSFSYTFTKPGTYTYFCSIHPKMTAKVVVQ
jgi:plastocyanin